jgi:lysophospholipase L1-like esterase
VEPADAAAERDAATAGAVPALPATMSRPARILVVGDSTASAMGEGLVQWAGAHPTHAQVTIRWAPGCGFIRTGTEEFEHAPYRAACDDIRSGLAADLAALQPDVVVLMVTIADTEGRTLEPGTALVRPGDARFDEVIALEYERFLVELLANGVDRVAWIVPPTPDTDDHELAPNLADPLRWSTLRRTIEQLGATHPSVLTVIDLDAWEAAQPRSGRPDGLHFSAPAASELAASYLAPTLIDLALQ